MAIHRYTPTLALTALFLSLTTACMGPVDTTSSAADGTGQPSSPSASIITPPPPSIPRSYSTDVMLFNGSGTWGTEVSSLADILSSNGASYQMVNSAQLDAMSLDDIAKFGLLLFPGGSGGTEAGSLTADTHARLRAAVQERGVSYLGFCAGAFIAFAPKPAAGQDVSYGLGIAEGPVLDYYYLENQGVTMQYTMETFADGTSRSLLWYGGPVTPSIKGGVIAKYPDGNPAITQTFSGNGFVIVSGPHPAAPNMGMTDVDGTDYDLAWKLISAALHQTVLPAF